MNNNWFLGVGVMWFSSFSAVPAVAAGFLRWRLLPLSIKAIATMLLLGLLCDQKKWLGLSVFQSDLIYCIYSFCEIALILVYFHFLPETSLKAKTRIAGVIAAACWLIVFIGGLTTHEFKWQFIFDALSALFLIYFSANHLLKLTMLGHHLFHSWQFWSLTSIFLYFFLSFFLLVLLGLLDDKNYWQLHAPVNILVNLLYLKAILVSSEKKS
jgi:hypothetical protein